MPVFLVILGAVLCVAAAATVAVAFTERSMVPVGIATLLVIGGVWLMWHGFHKEHVKFLDKHMAIYRDAKAQGFDVHSENVNARGGNYLYGTEVDIVAGKCIFAFNATKLNGTWRLTLPAQNGNGVRVIKARAVQQLKRACS